MLPLKEKNNCEKTCVIRKLFVPLQQSCKNDIEQQNCGITIGQIFLSARESVP